MQCEMSHDIDIILNYEQQKKANKKRRKRKRKTKQNTASQECSENATDADKCEENGKNEEDSIPDEIPSDKPDHTTTNTASGNHRAGFDAFMTGFCMATYYHQFKIQDAVTFAESVPNFLNKLNLSGKDIPLKIEKSQYCKTSVSHNETWRKVILNS